MNTIVQHWHNAKTQSNFATEPDFETIKTKNSTEKLIENVLADNPDNIANKMSREELTAYYEETYRLMSLEKSKDAAQQMAIVRASYLLMVHGRNFR